MNRRFELRCTDKDVEAFKAAAGREAAGSWARRVLRSAAQAEGAGEGVSAEIAAGLTRPLDEVLAEIDREEGLGEIGREAVTPLAAVSEPRDSREGTRPEVSDIPSVSPSPSPKRSGRQTAGAAAGLCVHRVPLGSFCPNCP